MSPDIVNLKMALEERVGYGINSILNCKRLDFWLKQKGIYISYSTISRIFGIAKLRTSPRQRTLDDLSLVLGYKSFDDFCCHFSNSKIINTPYIDLQIDYEIALIEENNKQATLLFLELVELNSKYDFLSKDLSLQLCRNFELNKDHFKILASNQLGRELFYLKFINEDDLTRNYLKSLEEILISDATPTELEFIELYSLRKKILSLDKIIDLEEWKTHSSGYSQNIHHISRNIEISLLLISNKSNKEKDKALEWITNRVINSFKKCTCIQEELALFGRYSRGILISKSEYWLKSQRNLCDTIIRLLNSEINDFEFQFPMYTLLNKIGYSKPTILPTYTSWPNAYFTSLFLFAGLEGKDSRQFYQKKLLVHPDFFLT